jgi:Tfp pilus assembly protein PilF
MRLVPLALATLLCFSVTVVRGAWQGGFVVTGRVSLPGGRPASRVMVKIEGLSGLSREVMSDDQGVYEIRGIIAGRYRMTVRDPNDPSLYTDPVEADTTRSGVNRLVVHIFLRRAKDTKEEIHKPAVVSVVEASQNVPKEARKVFEQGIKYKKDGKHDKAIESFTQAVKIFPDYFRALAERGELLLGTGKCSEAFADFERVLTLDEKYSPALRGAGYCRLEQQQFPEAARYLMRALHADPNDASAHLFLGIALITLNQDELAKEELREALKLDRDGAASAHIYLADIFTRSRQYKQAADELQIYLRAKPTASNAERLKAKEADLRARARTAPK